MMWGNGGCAIDSTRYGGFLSTIASQGILSDEYGADTRCRTALGIRGRCARGARLGGQGRMLTRSRRLKGKIALDKVAVMGQSCGGFLSLSMGADPARQDDWGVHLGCSRRRPAR